MLGDGRLGDAELALDHLADRAGGQLTVPEKLQDAPAHRIAEYVERVHAATISAAAYISTSLEELRQGGVRADRERAECLDLGGHGKETRAALGERLEPGHVLDDRNGVA